MKQRTLTGAMILATLILVIVARQITPYIFDAFILILAVVASYEMSNLFAKMGLYNNKYFAMSYPVLAYGFFIFGINTSMKWYVMLLVELSLIIVFVMGQWLYNLCTYKQQKNEILTRNLKIRVDNFSIYKSIHTMFIYLYPAFLMLFFVIINNLANMGYLFKIPVQYLGQISLFSLILSFTIPIFADTFAYLTGMLFKGPKLCPKISPNKTISGAIGGTVWGTVGAVLLFLIFNAIPEYSEAFLSVGFKFWHFIILGFVVSIICILGDLFESYLKRKANVKDSGNILPGHGGILDRMDSHIFCAPIIFIFLIILL